MTKKRALAWAAVSFVMTAGVGTLAADADEVVSSDHSSRRLRARLLGYNEVPAVSSTGRGTFLARLSADETEIQYRLDYSGLESAPTASHIHFGAKGTGGGIAIWLCGPLTLPPAGPTECGAPGGDGPEASGTLTAAGVIGPAAQGIAPQEFAELVRAIKGGLTYVNVHTSLIGGGEIRGQIRLD